MIWRSVYVLIAQARRKAVEQRSEVEAQLVDLTEQIDGARTGARLELAMETLKKSIEDEKVALRLQLQAEQLPGYQ